MKALLALLIAAGFLGLSGEVAHRCVFPGASGRFPPQESMELRVRGARMLGSAAWLPARGVPRGTVVYFHTTNQSAGDSFWFAADLADHGMSVLLPEHRGYGGRTGVPSREALFADAEDALTQLPADAPQPIVLVGRSLGAAVATEMAARGHGDALVLLSPFTTTAAVARGLGGFLPQRDRFDLETGFRRVRVPVAIAHGDADAVIPNRQGEALAQQHGARFLALPGAGHNDLSLPPHEGKVIGLIEEALDGTL